MIKVTTSGDFKHLDKFLRRMEARSYLKILDRFGAQGVAALKASTPEESGESAHAWTYEIIQRDGYFSIQWINTHTVQPGNVPVVVLIQYGHATHAGSYIYGLDFINPTMRPIFERIAEEAWREVTK